MEEYDPVANQWTALPPMNSARFDLAVVVYRHKIYAIGGSNGEVLNYVIFNH